MIYRPRLEAPFLEARARLVLLVLREELNRPEAFLLRPLLLLLWLRIIFMMN